MRAFHGGCRGAPRPTRAPGPPARRATSRAPIARAASTMRALALTALLGLAAGARGLGRLGRRRILGRGARPGPTGPSPQAWSAAADPRIALGSMPMRALLVAALVLAALSPASAQDGAPDLQALLQAHAEAIAKPSRRTVEEVVDALIGSGDPRAPDVLATWRDRALWRRDVDGLFFRGEETEDGVRLIDLATGEAVAEVGSREASQIRPNRGVQGVIGAALVRFGLVDPDPAARARALRAIEREPEESHLAALREAAAAEADPGLRTRMERLARILAIKFAEGTEARVEAIESLRGELGVEARAALNPVLATTRGAGEALPEDVNLAGERVPGRDLSEAEAYDLLVDAGLAPPLVTRAERRAALVANVEDGAVGGVPLSDLDDEAARIRAYRGLVAEGLAPEGVPEEARASLVSRHAFWDAYREPDAAVTDAARATLASIERRVAWSRALDLGLDGLSLASIYFLAAIGLAITFGVMGVINMAHGEFIMMGAYTGYLVQTVVPSHTLSILVALPLAFAVGAAAGVVLERLVIRHLMHRPLETLLATFGISIALQQLAKNLFGTQARPLTAPGWLNGAWAIDDVASISHVRVAIFVLAAAFLAALVLVLRRTRLGLEVRAVTQNPGMAASMGIDPDRVRRLTFALGSGIAGIAGVAIGLLAQVTSEMGSGYIVQSFMTVVVGGVGSVFGTLAGAGMIGGLQKGIEWLNPSNTLAAQTYMILFVILFIQVRPRGLVALRGRAAGD